MILTSLDLEMNQPSQSIIQIGAICGNFLTGEILQELSVIVNPNETLDPFIINLTGITQEQVNEGQSLLAAYKLLRAMHLKHEALINPITWGGGDSQHLGKELYSKHMFEDLTDASKWCFGRRWLDIKTLHQFHCMAKGIKIQAGLAKAMTRWGLAFKGRKHNALDDARNTFLLARAILGLSK